MKRARVELDQVVSHATLLAAFWRAARGRRHQRVVCSFGAELDGQLGRLREEVLAESYRMSPVKRFRIVDPKPRLITAPAFRDRVLQHALMAHVGPILDRALVQDTFACRVGKGSLAAARRAQHHLRRRAWTVQVDVRSYFASIDHERLLRALARHVKGRALLRLCAAVVEQGAPGVDRGLPIGMLTSQHFANLYLSSLDRALLADPRVQGMVRYMDDVAWWCASRSDGRSTLRTARTLVGEHLGLELKGTALVRPVSEGLTFCGYRIDRGHLRLSRRRRQRYGRFRRGHERAYVRGDIDGVELQRRYDATHAITLHAEAVAFRREDIRRRGTIDA